MSLKQKAVHGFGWTFAQQVGTQGIGFIVSIYLARILLPEEFGLIGMIAIFIAIGNVLINAGLTTSIIRMQNPTLEDYSTVFLTNLLGSIFIYFIIFLFAPLISEFFRQPQLINLIRVYSLSLIINAFSTVQLTRLTKELEFKRQLTIQIPSLVISSVLGLYLAYRGFGVWALVIMHLTQATLIASQLWIRTGWRPLFKFNNERFIYHFKFGYKLLLSGLIDVVYLNIYNLIIGRMFPAAQLGFYTRAMNMRQLPVQNLSTALNKVTFPVFTKIKDDDVKLKDGYKRIMQIVLFIIAPVLISLAILAEPLFVFLFTEKWLPAVPYFQILCIPGILYPLHAYNLNILNVKGRSDLFLKLEIIKRGFTTIGIICVIPFGIYGLLYFQIISSVFGFFVNTMYSGKMIQYNVWEQIKDIIGILVLASLIGIGLWWFKKYMVELDLSELWILIWGFILYFSIYIGLAWLTKFLPLKEIIKIMKRQ